LFIDYLVRFKQLLKELFHYIELFYLGNKIDVFFNKNFKIVNKSGYFLCKVLIINHYSCPIIVT